MTRLLVSLLAILAVGAAMAASASADGNIIATKGGDRSASDNVSGATTYASGVAGALFEYTTGDPTQPATVWTAFPAVTGANGQATVNVPNGVYYVRERNPGPGFTSFGPVTSTSFDGPQPYVARVNVTTNSNVYAFPHTNTSTNYVNWTPTNGNSGSNNGSPFINVRNNGVLPPGCGTNILLVLDRSGSIDPYKAQYEAAAKQFISSLNGTPTQIGIISFNNSVNSYSPAQGNSSFYQSPLSLANGSSAGTLNSTIEDIYDSPTSLTNWDGALQAAAAAKLFTADGTTGQTTNPDMVVFITDGNPTTSEADTSNSNEDLINLTSGMASANLVKNQAARGTGKVKLLAIGVGTGVTIDNLKVVSGPTQGVSGDYAAPTIPELSAFLSELAASQCGARIYVRKRVTGQTGNQAGWFYTASDPRPGQNPTYLDNNRATHSSGAPPVIQTGAFFANLPSTATTVNVNEDAAGQPMTNFELTSVDCRSGSYDGTPVAGGVKNGLQYSLPVNRGDTFYCTYTNAPKTTLSISKTPDNGFVNAGEDAEFTIQVTNTGTNVATGVTVNDTLPAGGTWTISQQPGGCSIAAGTLNCSLGNLNPGQSVSVKVKTTTTYDQCAVYDNVAAQAAASNAPAVTDSGKITCRKPNLSIDKTGNGPINAGQDVSFTITVNNAGPGTAKSVSLSDSLPGGTSGPWGIASQAPGNPCTIVGSSLNCSFGDLAAGQGASVTVKAPTSNAACTLYNNTASLSAGNAPTIQDSASVNCQKPGLGTLKTAVEATISAGDMAEFEITVTNTGPGTATGVTLSDPLPAGVAGAWDIVSQPGGNPCSITAGTLNCNFGDLAAGASRTVKVQAPTNFENCSQLVNVATASATNAPNAADDATINCQKPNLSVDKSGNGTVNAGENVTFQVVVSNAGPGIARSVTLNDPLPAGTAAAWTITSQPAGNPCSIAGGVLSCTFGDMAAGVSHTVNVSAPTSFANCTQYNNTATASSTNAPQASDNASVNCLKPNLVVDKSGNGTVSAGEPVSFSVSVTNQGPGVAKSVTLSDPLPSGISGSWTITSQPGGNPCSITAGTLNCNFGDLAAGASRTVTVGAATDFQNCAKYDNTATASATNAPQATDSASVQCQKPSLTIDKTGNGSVNAGENVVFTMNVQNGGPGVAKSVTLSDPLPAGIAGSWSITSQPAGNPCAIVAGQLNCDFGDLAAGVSRSVTVSAATDFEHCATYNNTATAVATNHGQVSDGASVNCLKPGLKIVKTGNGPVDAGDDIEFTITVSNDGPGVAKSVTLGDPLPTGAAGAWTIVSQPAGNPCSIAADVLTCNFGDMNAGASAQVKVKAPTSHDACRLFENTGTAGAQGLPSVEDSASVNCRKPTLGTLKTAVQGTISAGDTAQFEITVSNTGEGTAKDVTLSDPLPTGVSGAWSIVTQPAGDPCSITAGTLTCDFGDLASGESRTVKVEAATDFENCSQLDNLATASATNAPDASDNATINCQKPNLVLTKSGNGTVNAGENVTFSMTLTNNGPGVAKSAKISDPLPTGVSGSWSITSQPAGDPCAITAGTLDCDFGDLASGASRSVTVSAATSFENCATYVNTATGTASNHPNVTDSATDTCQKPNLVLTKSGNGTVNAGENVTFSMTLTNNGPGVAKSATINDPLPSGTEGAWSITSQPAGDPCAITAGTLDCDFGDLASGASRSVTVSAATSFENCATYVNTATGTASNHPNVTDSATDTCQKSNVGVLKTAVQATISAGDTAQFEITVSNTGDGTAKDVTLSDPLPAGVSGDWSIVSQPAGDPCSITAGTLTCDFGDLATGESRTVKVEAATDFENCAELVNLATASSSNAPDASDSATINCQKPNLVLEKTGNGTVNAGEDVTFSMTLTNNGPGVAKAAKISDPLPTGVEGDWTITSQPTGDPCAITAGTLNCDFGDLASGEERSVTVSAATSYENCTEYVNQATGSASNHPNVNDSATDTCLPPNVGTLKTAVQATISAGDTAQFEVTVSNTGTGTAKDVTLSDPLPAGVSGDWSIVSQPAGDPCSITAGTLTCDFGDLTSGESRTVKVEAATDFENCAELVNLATASSSNAPDASDSATINCQKPDLVLTKSGNGTVNAGEDVTFTLTLKNNGPGVAKSAKIGDPLPSGTEGAWSITSQPAGDPCAITAGTLNCDFGDLASGEERSVTVSAATSFENCTIYANTATGSASNHPDVTGTATDTCLKPNVGTLKTAVQGTISAGDEAEFTVKVTNTGDGVAKSVTLDDPLPPVAGPWSIVSQPQGNPCSIQGDHLTCDFGDLASGASVEVTVNAVTDFEHCAELVNVATASANNAPDATDDATIDCQKPDLKISKNGNGPVSAGEDIQFGVEVSNLGPGVAKAVVMTDTLPSGTAGPWVIDSTSQGTCNIEGGVLDCDFGDLASGVTATVTVSAPTDAENCGTYDNTATFTAGNAPSGTDDATVVCLKPKLKLVKNGNGPVDAGKKVKFTITASNDGPGKATDVKISDPLPNGTAGAWKIESKPASADCSIANRKLDCDLGDLDAGESVSIRVAAPTSDVKCRRYRNVADETASNAAPLTATDTVRCIKPDPKLQLRKKANRKRVFPGDTVRYRIMVRNIQKGSTAKNLKICDRLPGQMTVASRGKGSFFENGKLCWRVKKLGYSRKWRSFRYTARVNDNVSAGTRLKNVVTLGNLRATRTVVVKRPEVSPARRTPVTG